MAALGVIICQSFKGHFLSPKRYYLVMSRFALTTSQLIPILGENDAGEYSYLISMINCSNSFLCKYFQRKSLSTFYIEVIFRPYTDLL